MRRLHQLALLAGILTIAVLSDTVEGTSPGQGRALRRTEVTTVVKGGWTASCIGDACAELSFVDGLVVRTPSAVSEVDVVLSATLDYRTSAGDSMAVEARYRAPGASGQLRPGRFRLVSPSPDLLTTSTLTWAKRRLPGAGRRYTFEILLLPRPGADDEMEASGRKLTVVVEVWRAGP